MSASQFKALQTKLEAVERAVSSQTRSITAPVASNNDEQVKTLSAQVTFLQQQLNQLNGQLKSHYNEVRDNIAKSVEAVKCTHKCKCDEVKAQLEEQMKNVCKCQNSSSNNGDVEEVEGDEEVQDENCSSTKKRGPKKKL